MSSELIGLLRQMEKSAAADTIYVTTPSTSSIRWTAARLSSDAADRIEAMQEEIDLLRARSPRPYILRRASEWVRLFREVHGYLRTCHSKHGTDWAGRNHAMNALIEGMKFMEADDAARETTLEALREAELAAQSSGPNQAHADGDTDGN